MAAHDFGLVESNQASQQNLVPCTEYEHYPFDNRSCDSGVGRSVVHGEEIEILTPVQALPVFPPFPRITFKGSEQSGPLIFGPAALRSLAKEGSLVVLLRNNVRKCLLFDDFATERFCQLFEVFELRTVVATFVSFQAFSNVAIPLC